MLYQIMHIVICSELYKGSLHAWTLRSGALTGGQQTLEMCSHRPLEPIETVMANLCQASL